MNFTLKIMGTASAMPVVGRFQSAHVLEVHGRSFLIDSGEGVQSQLKRHGISLMRLDSIFISHIHGDHVFGLFGLLSTIGMLGRTAPLNLYGPANLGPILKFFLSFYGDGLAFEVRFTPLKMKGPEVIYQTKNVEVLAFPLNHGIETFGYLFREKQPPYNVRKEAIERYGLSRDPEKGRGCPATGRDRHPAFRCRLSALCATQLCLRERYGPFPGTAGMGPGCGPALS